MNTCEIRLTVVAVAPDSKLAVPPTLPTISLITHTGTPPAESGSSLPKKYWQVPLGRHEVLLVHLIDVSFVHRRLSMSPLSALRFGSGPLRVQSPHGVVPPGPAFGHAVTSRVSVPSEMRLESWEMPVQPVSRRLSGLEASPSNSTLPGQLHRQDALQISSPLPALGQVALPGGSHDSAGDAMTPSPQLGVGVMVGVGLAVKVGVGVTVIVAVGVRVTLAVDVGVGVGVSVGAAVGVGAAVPPHAGG